MTPPIINADDPQVITTVSATLKTGGLVIFPTETVYGALVDATSPRAVAKLLTYKRRPAGKPISIACASAEMASKFVILNDQARQIYTSLLPGPITVISASQHQVVPELESELGTLGIRLSSHPLLQRLLAHFPTPVTATSANSSGKKTPYAVTDVLTHVSTKQQQLIDLIVDAGTLPPNPPSLVIDTTTTTPTVVRDHRAMTQQVFQLLGQTTSTSVSDTQKFAREIITQEWSTITTHGLVLALDGPLGAGKTVFAQGIAGALGIKDPVTSPTYTYLKEYDFNHRRTSGKFCHVDAWAIDNQAMWEALNITSYQKPGNIIVLEWYEQIKEWLKLQVPGRHLLLTLTANDQRLIQVSSL